MFDANFFSNFQSEKDLEKIQDTRYLPIMQGIFSLLSISWKGAHLPVKLKIQDPVFRPVVEALDV